ncbi:MAG: general secretion pathway protein GspB [Betaproteobacteria bacterium]
MSYILDALRKAEAERQRGAVPGLHAQALPAAELPAGRAGAGRRLAVALAGAVLLCAAGGAWWWWRGAPAPKFTPAAAPALPTMLPANPAEVVQTVPPPVPVAEPAAQASVPIVSAPPLAAETMAAPPAAKSPPVPAPAPGPSPVPSPAPASPATTPAPPAVPAAPALQAPPVRLADLPEARRRELPPLVLSGAVQSPDPAARLLILDGQVLREGDALSPGLTLERIGPRAAVFSLRGLRFELPL